jgi:hypothetical protein
MSDGIDGKMKKVVIKVLPDGIEVVSKDGGVAIILLLPDGSETEVLEGEVRAFGHTDDDLPPTIKQRIDP